MTFDYDQWHRTRPADTGDEAPWQQLVLGLLDLRPELLAERRVLEIGCGRGGLSLQLARRSPRLQVAADYSEGALEVARGRAGALGLRSIRWEQQDIQRIAWPDASFDLVISCETIEHVGSIRRAIRELARVLAPGGTLLLTTPNYLGALGLYRAYLGLRGREYSEEGQAVNRWMFLPVTLALVIAAGLAPEAVDGVGHYAYLPGAPPRRVRALDRLRTITRWTAVHSLIVARKR